MKNRGTWIILAIFVFFAGLTFWDFQHEKSEELRKGIESRLVDFPPDQIQKLAIKAGKLNVELNKTVDGWMLETPWKDQADNSFVESMVGQMTAQQSLSEVASGQELDLTIYGLDAPAGTITLVHQNGEEASYEIGSKKSYEGKSYLRKKGENAVHLVNSDWSQWLESKDVEFRDKRLLRSRIASVSRIEVNNQNGRTVLEQKENNWFVEGKKDWDIDQNRVRELLSQISEAHGTDIVGEGKMSAAKLATWGLHKPSFTLKLKLGDENWTADFAMGKNKEHYILTSDPKFVMPIAPSFYDEIAYVKAIKFKNRKAPFDFNKDLVKKIEVDSSIKKVNFLKEGDEWKLDPADPQSEIQASLVASLPNTLHDLNLVEYLPKAQNFKPVHKIALKDQEDQLTFELTWGHFSKKKFDGSELDVALAKTSLSPDTFYIEKAEIERLSLERLVLIKEGSKD